jgi:hypothetical protein
MAWPNEKFLSGAVALRSPNSGKRFNLQSIREISAEAGQHRRGFGVT